MTIDQVIEYVLHTPYNTNRAILTEMLKQLILSNGGSVDPDTPDSDVVYDGGVEV
jgi:hypothetical protein